ncbi:MAG: hypothetical protein U1E95_07505 [Rubrivivax sp.]
MVKIGVMNDMSGLYADIAGGSMVAAKLAIEDFEKSLSPTSRSVVSADHQNKPTSARRSHASGTTRTRSTRSSTCPRRWRLRQPDHARQGQGLHQLGAGTSDLNGKACNPNTVHWTYDTWMLANGTGTAMTKAAAATHSSS